LCGCLIFRLRGLTDGIRTVEATSERVEEIKNDASIPARSSKKTGECTTYSTRFLFMSALYTGAKGKKEVREEVRGFPMCYKVFQFNTTVGTSRGDGKVQGYCHQARFRVREMVRVTKVVAIARSDTVQAVLRTVGQGRRDMGEPRELVPFPSFGF
jgi:hypothetical protein